MFAALDSAAVPRPTLSFCTATNGPGDRVRALLEAVRPHVDEIVLAADAKGGESALEGAGDLADRRLTFPLDGRPIERVFGWLLHQCSGEWILRLDDDEVPSPAMLEALPELLADRYPLAVAFRRRWLVGSPDRYITSHPWALEYQARLVRNVPSQWRFEGRPYSPGEWLGDVRRTDVHFYHLDLIVHPEERRRAKRDRYTALQAAVAWEGYSLHDMYVPEDRAGLETAAVPPQDAAAIAAGVRPAPAPAAAPGAPPVEVATFEETDVLNTLRAIPEEAYRGEIVPIAPRRHLPPEVVRHFELDVRNLGTELWRRDERPPLFQLGWRWFDRASGRQLLGEGRQRFAETVRPGRTTRVILGVPMPAVPGEYELEIDIVHEHVRWFACPVRIPVTVGQPQPQPQPRAEAKPRRRLLLRRARD